MTTVKTSERKYCMCSNQSVAFRICIDIDIPSNQSVTSRDEVATAVQNIKKAESIAHQPTLFDF